MEKLRQLRKLELAKIAEVADRTNWVSRTLGRKVQDKATLLNWEQRLQQSKLAVGDLKTGLKGGLLTYLLHW